MNLQLIGLVAVVVLFVGFLFFRKRMQGLKLDLMDAVLSWLDTFLGGGLGLDWGDWIAAIIIFWRESKVTGVFFALVVAWEATNFFPFSLIPVVGEILEAVTNLLPSVTIFRFLFSKFGKADELIKKLKAHIKTGKKLKISTDDEKKAVEKAEEEDEHDDPIDAIKYVRKADSKLSKRIREKIDKMREMLDARLDELFNSDIEVEDWMIEYVHDQILDAEGLMEDSKQEKDFDEALEMLGQANGIVDETFDKLDEYAHQAA